LLYEKQDEDESFILEELESKNDHQEANSREQQAQDREGTSHQGVSQVH